MERSHHYCSALLHTLSRSNSSQTTSCTDPRQEHRVLELTLIIQAGQRAWRWRWPSVLLSSSPGVVLYSSMTPCSSQNQTRLQAPLTAGVMQRHAVKCWNPTHLQLCRLVFLSATGYSFLSMWKLTPGSSEPTRHFDDSLNAGGIPYQKTPLPISTHQWCNEAAISGSLPFTSNWDKVCRQNKQLLLHY